MYIKDCCITHYFDTKFKSSLHTDVYLCEISSKSGYIV